MRSRRYYPGLSLCLSQPFHLSCSHYTLALCVFQDSLLSEFQMGSKFFLIGMLLKTIRFFPILAEKGGWWSLETHSKEKDLLSTKFPQLNLSQLNLSLKFHSHRGRTFISFCEKKKKNVLMAF